MDDGPSTLARYRPPRFLCGLDIGKSGDPTALTILERHMILMGGVLEPRFDCRFLERVPLQTAYPTMVEGVRKRLLALNAPCVLVIDATGVGAVIVDLFREGWTDYDPITLERVTMPGKPVIIAVTISANAGTGVRETPAAQQVTWDNWIVPKRSIVFGLIVALQQRRFRVAQALPDAAMLFKEGQNFAWKPSAAGNDLYGAWREGQHDDMLLAVAIAVWWGELYAPRTLPTTSTQYATPSGNPLARRRVVMGGRR
jgi:hypothetical protein